MEMFINTNNWKEHFTASSSVSTRQGHWVAVCSWGGPPRHILGGFAWIQCECHCADCPPSGTWLPVPPSCQPRPPPGTPKVSWTTAQINVTSDPAGVVSGSAGQRGDKLVFVQQKLRVVLYLKRAIITSVTGVLTGRRSCRGAMHHGNARPENRWPLTWLCFFFSFFFSPQWSLPTHGRPSLGGWEWLLHDSFNSFLLCTHQKRTKYSVIFQKGLWMIRGYVVALCRVYEQ